MCEGYIRQAEHHRRLGTEVLRRHLAFLHPETVVLSLESGAVDCEERQELGFHCCPSRTHCRTQKTRRCV